MTAGEREAGSARSVAVLGAGSWGTTFAKILADAAAAAGDPRTIRLWGRRAEVVDQINTSHVRFQIKIGFGRQRVKFGNDLDWRRIGITAAQIHIGHAVSR